MGERKSEKEAEEDLNFLLGDFYGEVDTGRLRKEVEGEPRSSGLSDDVSILESTMLDYRCRLLRLTTCFCLTAS